MLQLDAEVTLVSVLALIRLIPFDTNHLLEGGLKGHCQPQGRTLQGKIISETYY